MAKKIIAVDADDTIFDENTAVRLFINETYGYNHTAEDYLVPYEFDYYWEHIWQVDGDKGREMFENFLTSSHKQNLKPMPGALETLRALKENYELVIVTARDQKAVELTHRSLEEHYPSIFKDVHFTPLWGSGDKVTKAAICNEIGASYLIDDNFEHCELAAEAGVKAILFGTYGWNQQPTLPKNVVRCRDWKEVAKYFGV